MSGIPFKKVTALSLGASFAVVSYRPDILLTSRPTYIGTFALFWILSFSSWAFYIIILYPKFFSPLRHLPSPEGGSWWNGQHKIIAALPTGAPQIEWANNIPNDGIIRYNALLNAERIMITSPKGLSEVLTTRNYDFVKPSHVSASIGRLLGIGILLAEGDEHKMQRKNLMPAFAYRHLKNLVPVFWDISRQAVEAMTVNVNAGGLPDDELSDAQDKLNAASDVAVIEVGEWASRATLDIIGTAGLGVNFGAVKDPNTLLNRTYRKVFKPSRQAAVLGLLNLFLPNWLVRNLPIKRNGEIEEATAIIRDTCRHMIRDKKAKLEKKEQLDADILSVAIESGGFTEEQLIDQLMTFLAAGHETTATAMTWAIYMLARDPKVQSRLRAEIREKLPSASSNETASSTDIDSMPYLNAVCSEVLRYFPPVPLTLRDAVCDTVILGQKIPKGTRVMLIPWAIHKNTAMWGEDAAVFNPERWMPSEKNPYSANGGASSNYAYMTFLHGPRSCIGQSFAKAEFACLLAAWAGRFEFELNDKAQLDEKNVKIKGGITAKPFGGMYVRTKIIEGW